MKNANNIKNRKRESKCKHAYTLIEVLVTLSIFSLLVPSVLMVSLHITRQAISGAEHDSSIAKGRNIQQKFIRMVNSSESFLTKDNGNILELKMYNSNTSSWENSALCFLPSQNALKFFERGSDGMLQEVQTLSLKVYRHDSNPIFSAAGNLVRIQLLCNESPRTTDGSGKTGILIDVITSPRNAGRQQ